MAQRASLALALALLGLAVASAHLAENTQVSLADGTQKQLREIRLGDEVQSYDEASRAVSSSTVVAIFEAWLPLEQLADVRLRLAPRSADVHSQSRHLRSAGVGIGTGVGVGVGVGAGASGGVGVDVDVGIGAFSLAESLGASGPGRSGSGSGSGLIVTRDHPIYSARAQGMVSMDPAATFKHYGLRVGQMQQLELLRPLEGLPLEAAVGNWTEMKVKNQMNVSRVITLRLEGHHWFFAQGVLVHNKGGDGEDTDDTDDTDNRAGVWIGIGSSLLGFGMIGIFWRKRQQQLLQLEEQTRMQIEMPKDVEANQTALQTSLRLSLSGTYTENGKTKPCTYELNFEEGLISGTGQDDDCPAEIQGKVCYPAGAPQGTVVWTERRPTAGHRPVTIQLQGSLRTFPSTGKFCLSGDYISDYRCIRGSLSVEGGKAWVGPEPSAVGVLVEPSSVGVVVEPSAGSSPL